MTFFKRNFQKIQKPDIFTRVCDVLIVTCISIVAWLVAQ